MPRTSTSDRARRLVALLGRLRRDTRFNINDLASELGTTADELASDLESLSMCGVFPYDPWGMVPLILEGDEVVVFGEMPAVTGAIRLSAAEASALASALQTAGFTADDPLTGRLLQASAASFDAEKLEHTLRSAIATHEVGVYETIANAVREHRVVEIEHVSGARGEAACRRVEPLRLFAERGAWYVSAWCHKAGDRRTFRVDRILAAHVTGAHFDPTLRGAAQDAADAFSAEGLPVARLRFAPGEDFSDRDWPGATATEQADGSMVADVPYAGTAWIARRVVSRLGAVTVEEPREVREAVAQLAAKLRGELG